MRHVPCRSAGSPGPCAISCSPACVSGSCGPVWRRLRNPPPAPTVTVQTCATSFHPGTDQPTLAANRLRRVRSGRWPAGTPAPFEPLWVDCGAQCTSESSLVATCRAQWRPCANTENRGKPRTFFPHRYCVKGKTKRRNKTKKKDKKMFWKILFFFHDLLGLTGALSNAKLKKHVVSYQLVRNLGGRWNIFRQKQVEKKTNKSNETNKTNHKRPVFPIAHDSLVLHFSPKIKPKSDHNIFSSLPRRKIFETTKKTSLVSALGNWAARQKRWIAISYTNIVCADNKNILYIHNYVPLP